MRSPFSRYNLYRNPFGELTRAERAELAVVEDLDVWLAALADSRTAIQFFGDCGFGKTTHLLAIEQRLKSVAYVEQPKQPALLAKILNRRVAASRVVEGLPIPLIDEEFAAQLLKQLGSNLRRIEHFLYARFQRCISEQSSWPPAI